MIPLYVRVSMDLLDILVVFGGGIALGMIVQWRRSSK